MNLSVYLDKPDNDHKQQGNPHVEANAVYKKEDNFNCYLTATQAMGLAHNLLMKAQLIIEAGIDDAVVHLWNKGKDNERLYCGLNKARKGRRRKKPDELSSA